MDFVNSTGRRDEGGQQIVTAENVANGDLGAAIPELHQLALGAFTLVLIALVVVVMLVTTGAQVRYKSPRSPIQRALAKPTIFPPGTSETRVTTCVEPQVGSLQVNPAGNTRPSDERDRLAGSGLEPP
jgi:hypothetical protein